MYSELIPCLDRNLIYQLRLKLNMTLMEHYERQCPPTERRYNCLVPPPVGYKVGYVYFCKEMLFIEWSQLDPDKLIIRVSDPNKMAK